MLGSSEDPGIMMQTLGELFHITRTQREKNYKISMSYLEVYNENIRDLLGDNETCHLREDPIRLAPYPKSNTCNVFLSLT